VVEPVEAAEVVEPVEAAEVTTEMAAAATASRPDDLTSDELAEIEHALAAAHPGASGQAAEEAPDLPLATPADRAGAARGQTRSLLRRFRPRRHAVTEPEPGIAAAPEAAATAEPQPAAATPEPELVPAAPSVAAPATPPPEPAAPEVPAPEVPAPPRDVVAQPVWQMVAPDVEKEAPASWPEAPAWPAGPPAAPVVPGAAGSAWASRLATARPEVSGVWGGRAARRSSPRPPPAGRTGPGQPSRHA